MTFCYSSNKAAGTDKVKYPIIPLPKQLHLISRAIHCVTIAGNWMNDVNTRRSQLGACNDFMIYFMPFFSGIL